MSDGADLNLTKQNMDVQVNTRSSLDLTSD